MSRISELSVPAIVRAILALAVIVGGASAASPAMAQGAPGPLPVSVAKPIKREVTDKAEFTGRFEASGLVEVRAQVSGQLMEVLFRDGADVKKGEALFKIDPRPYQNALDQAQASVATARTRIDLTKADVDRAKDLLKTGNISDQVAQQRNQAYLEAQASLQSAQAALATAKLNLEWTDVRSPIDGRIGRKLVTEGNLISAGAGATLLATIVNVRPIYFYFDVDEQSFLRYVGYIRDNLVNDANGGAPVSIALPGSDKFNIEGRIDFADNQLDQQTGTLRLRAIMPNQDASLVAGVFGQLRMQASEPFEALLVPDVAILSDQTRKIVMTVGPDNKVVPKVVELGQLDGELRIIRSGLTPDDRVIVDGLMRARPGSEVIPQTVDPTKPADPAAGAAKPAAGK
ncbi:efflux RND transporter periplasmic adaptor subunit [Hansschlegelia beijingensis]|uniref:efflux RND transporter periplasmic adaptor subunit n=1 Tax=Hansschlegelia beijingensis TaxID=1133344 RepID=UPI00387EEE60